MRLSQSEEQILQYLWKREKAFTKDLLSDFPEGRKPKPTTLATFLTRMQEKKLIAYRKLGNAREYYPLISKKAYFSQHLKGLISNFFDDSAAQFASFFAEETALSEEQLKELRAMVDKKLNDKEG